MRSNAKRAARLLLIAAPLFVAGCEHPAVRDAREAALRARTEGVDLSMPFGLSCDQCLHGHTQFCVDSNSAPLAAIVSAAETIQIERDCPGARAAGPNEYIVVCSTTRLYRFEEITPLRGDVSVTNAATFEARISYPEVDRSAFEQTRAVGPLLDPEKRYVIFASPDLRDRAFAADWYLSIACPVEADFAPLVTP
jgi:hypothetical protein